MYAFDLCRQYPGYQINPVLTGLGVKVTNSLSSLTDFIETRRACILSFFWPFRLTNYIKLFDLIIQQPKPVFFMTVHEAHQEYYLFNELSYVMLALETTFLF